MEDGFRGGEQKYIKTGKQRNCRIGVAEFVVNGLQRASRVEWRAIKR